MSQSNTLGPGDRVRVVSSAGAEQHVGKVGWVKRLYTGTRLSVDVSLDGEDGVFAFAPDELVVIR